MPYSIHQLESLFHKELIMKRYAYIAMALCTIFSASLATAQPSTITGKWVANWEANGRPMEAHLEIGDQGSTWQALARNRQNACVGIDAPVEVSYVSDSAITMILSFSKALRGCNDVTLRLHKTPDGNIAGERDAGTVKANITLKRP